MARLPRLYAPGVTQLVQARFARPLAVTHDVAPTAVLDRLQAWLETEIRRHDLALHGWALVPDSIILLATPPNATALPGVIQGIGRRMAAGMIHGRVFEGRYRSALVDNSWAMACLVWCEWLPVRQSWVEAAAQWPWSSAQEHVGLRADTGLLNDHASYWNLGNTPYARQAQHRARLQAGNLTGEAGRIERSLFGQWALGDEDFIQRMASRSNRRAVPAPPGRPRKAAVSNTVTK